MDRFAVRRDRVRRALRKTGADALLVTNFSNVTYLTGFTGDSSHLLLTGDRELLITDTRYATQLADECPALELHVRTSKTKMIDATVKVVGGVGISTLAIEAESMTVQTAEDLREKLPKLPLLPTSEIVERLRAIKDKGEIDEIRQAIRYAERAISIIRASLSPNETERDVANRLEFEMRRLGARSVAFPSIVAVGRQAALPHGQPGERRIADSDHVLIDWGAPG